MTLAQTRVSMPETARRGEIVRIKTLIRHPMETGYRVDDLGKPIPRNIVTHFSATYGGEDIIRMECGPGISANPLLTFTTLATETGELVFTWTDDQGLVVVERRTLTVTA